MQDPDSRNAWSAAVMKDLATGTDVLYLFNDWRLGRRSIDGGYCIEEYELGNGARGVRRQVNMVKP
jgi:hypothetical protein